MGQRHCVLPMDAAVNPRSKRSKVLEGNMGDTKFSGRWANNKGEEGLFELVSTEVPSVISTTPHQGKVFFRNQDAPGAKVSEIECEGQYYLNDAGIPVVEFRFYDVHALCVLSQIGNLQGTFVSSRDHGEYIAERSGGQKGDFEAFFSPFVKQVKSGQPSFLNDLMTVIKSEIEGADFAKVALERGDVLEYCWMPRDRMQYVKWQYCNRGDMPKQNCSQAYKIGVTPVHYPSGWIRFGIRRPSKPARAVLYHGTGPDAVLPILTSALRPGAAQEGCPQGKKAVYLTPSIVYASSPRYAEGCTSRGFSDIFRCGSVYVQCVLEVTTFCDPDKRQAETLGVGWAGGNWATRAWGSQAGGDGKPYPRECKVIDPNFCDNSDLEWLYCVANDSESQNKMEVTGLLIRVTDDDPENAYQTRKENTPVTTH